MILKKRYFYSMSGMRLHLRIDRFVVDWFGMFVLIQLFSAEEMALTRVKDNYFFAQH